MVPGGAADCRIVGLEQHSPDSDEIAGPRPERQRHTLFAARSQCHLSISLATAERRIARSHLGG